MSSGTVHWLMERWLSRFGEAVEGMVGEKPNLTQLPAGSPVSVGDEILFWRQKLSLDSAEVWAAVPQETWTAIGNRVLALAGIENPAADELRSTFLEILGQSLSLIASDLTLRVGEEVTLGQGGVLDAPPLDSRGLS